jgi:hypothetical protein
LYNIHNTTIWFKAFIDCFNIKQSQLFTIEKNGNILNLYVRTKRFNPFVQTKILAPLAHGANDFFLLGTNPGSIAETAAYYTDELVHKKQKWDQLLLTEVPGNDFFISHLIENLAKKGFEIEHSEPRSFYHIDLTKNWDEHYKSHIHKKTLDLRTRINKLKREGFSYEVETLTKNISPYLDLILEFYRERRQHTGQPNAFSNLQHAQMLKQIIPEYEKHGWMKLSILKGSDGNDWAYQLDFVKDGIQYHYAPTFDMKYAAYSPSKILLLETIKQGFANPGLHEFNFMRGESDYKKQFAYAKTPFVNIVVNNPDSKRSKIYNAYNKLSYIKVAFQKLTK